MLTMHETGQRVQVCTQGVANTTSLWEWLCLPWKIVSNRLTLLPTLISPVDG